MINLKNLKGKKVTIMGLGLHGGGIASARFFAEAGSIVTVTDLGSMEKLQPSVEKLSDLDIKFVLGEHRESDFSHADLVIKNPAVPGTSPFLKMAKQIETDISVFLQLTTNTIIAVTGSKGKSTTVSAVYHVLKQVHHRTRLGGNITVSPLTFLHDLKPDDTVILELSSWQLADLGERDLLKPEIAVITNIMHDHQNRYNKFEDYVADKKLIYRNQKNTQISIFSDDSYGKEFQSESKGTVYTFHSSRPLKEKLDHRGWIEDSRGYFSEDGVVIQEIVPSELLVPGEHFRSNMLIAAMILIKSGVEPEKICRGLKTFTGVTHRMELFTEKNGISFYNDSAATIPEATVAAIESFKTPLILIAGGTDKELHFDCLKDSLKSPKAIFLLQGSGTDKILEILRENNIIWNGPYCSLKEALQEAVKSGEKGDSIILSPGSTSFGMFLNEFDRGDKFKELVNEL